LEPITKILSFHMTIFASQAQPSEQEDQPTAPTLWLEPITKILSFHMTIFASQAQPSQQEDLIP